MMKLTLILNGNTQNLELDQDLITIGRSDESTVTIKNKKISRKHAKIERIGEGFQITDLESGNGTRVNGKKIDFAPLAKDDVIKIGDAVITVEEIDEEPEKISLDDDDEQDLLPQDENIHEVKTERNLTPLEPGLHSKDTEMEIDLPPPDDSDDTEIKIVSDDETVTEPDPEPEPKAEAKPAEKPKVKFRPKKK